MPRTKKVVQKRKSPAPRKARKPLERAPFEAAEETEIAPVTPEAQKRSRRLYLAGTAVVLASLLIVYLFKNGMIVSAVVNGKPIFSWQLNSVMASRFGQQTLEGMITETLIQDEARQQNVTITDADVAARQKQMLSNIGGQVSLDDLLKYQGITRDEFDKQIRMQLIVEKILGKDIVITDKDVDAFIASYSGQLVATNEAAMKEEARQAIFEQEISKKVQPWFTDIKTKASIIKFL